MNQGTFLMRGLDKIRGEFSLTAPAYNQAGDQPRRRIRADPGDTSLSHAAIWASAAPDIFPLKPF